MEDPKEHSGSKEHSVPERGIIVVDANMLEEMSTGLPKLLPTLPRSPITTSPYRTNSYLDVLPVLAQQGYHIIIPETVALETAQMLTGGNDLNRYFTHHTSTYPTQNTTRAFLSNVISKRYPNIEVKEADDTGGQGYENYISELLAAMAKRDPDRVRAAVKEVHKRYKDTKKDMGEKHCYDVIEDEMAHQLQTRAPGDCLPIFFLSADEKARVALRERRAENHEEGDPPVHVLTSGGLYLALAIDQCSVGGTQSNAFNQMGLPGTVEQHWEHIVDVRSKIDTKIPPTANGRDGYEDSPVEKYGTGTFPFEKSARGIAVALAEKQALAGVGSHVAALPPVRPQGRAARPQDRTGSGNRTDSGQSSSGR